MKKTLLFILFLCFQFMGAQEKFHLSIDQVEQEIAVYTKKKIDSYALSPKEILRIKAAMMDEISHHGREFDEEKFKNSLNDFKTSKLRLAFFSKYPEKMALYEDFSLNSNARQTCSNGNFEGSNLEASGYVLTHSNGATPFNYLDINNNTTIITRIPFGGLAPGFAPFANSTILNNFNSFATFVTNGQDPDIPILQRVFNGNRSIKINRSENNGQTDVTTMTRVFTINENTFNYNYSLVMENPDVNHFNAQPFF